MSLQRHPRRGLTSRGSPQNRRGNATRNIEYTSGKNWKSVAGHVQQPKMLIRNCTMAPALELPCWEKKARFTQIPQESFHPHSPVQVYVYCRWQCVTMSYAAGVAWKTRASVHCLFRNLYESRTLPATWKSVLVTTVFRKGTKCESSIILWPWPASHASC